MNQTSKERQSRFRMKEPPLYNVIMHNDDHTTMDFVVMVLIRIFRKSEADAETIMLKIHHEGSAVVGTYTKDIAQTKAAYTVQLARANGFPLQLTVTQVDA